MADEPFDLTPGIDTAIDYTVNIVARYVVTNHVPVAELPALIASVHAAIAGLSRPAAAASEHVSAAEIRKSITPDAIVSFLDGRPYKSMKRHLTANGVTPDAYRTRFGLPADYPMVAPNYAAKRSAIAKGIQLGQRRAPLQAVA